ncbi:MAG: 1-acyl-sn-glycerol-3-phosphate acyltransferase [Myxococcaceae bacterium]|nr:1-acyl-sn-glycerol-3-phosphate acyltransferase [Myxococcaceae bacterium]
MIFHMLVHATWITLLFPFAVIAMIFQPRSGAVWMARLIWAPFLVYMSRAKLIVEGREHVDPKRPTIYVSNHQSTFDIPVLFVSLPVNFRFVAKQALRWVPVLGWYLWIGGHILIDRSNRHAAIRTLDRAAEKIRGGTSILIFPEGTRSPDGRILPFKKGPFALALKAGVAICPVTIEGTARLMPKNSWKIRLGGTIRVKIGAPIDASTYGPEERDRLMRDVRDAIIRQSLELGGAGGDREDVVAAVGREGVGMKRAGGARS